MTSTRRHHLAVAAALSGWALAAALLVTVTVAGPFEAAGLSFDRLTTSLLVLVTGLGALVSAFSTRYLQDDPRLGRFLALVAVTTVGTGVFATAASLALLVAGWLVASAGFAGLLAHRRDVRGGRAALRQTLAAFAISDLALLVAGGIVLASAGNVRLDGGEAGGIAAQGLVGVLLVVAALGRCAQVPLHRWLPATVAAPTPVSALLHAGVVNAGGILLIRLAPVTGLSSTALALLLAAGACSVVYGTAVMLVRSDVKGSLAHSTIAQMGFMLVQIAIGAVAAAVVHLVGHAMYKSTLFLGSGSAVAARRRLAAAPAGAPMGPRLRALAALGLPLAALAGAVAAAGGTSALGGSEVLILMVFAWASGAHMLDGWLRSGPPRALLAGAVATVAAAAGYVALLASFKAFLGGALPALGGVDPLLAAPLAAAAAAGVAARVLDLRLGRASAALYALVLDAGAPRRGTARAGRPRHPVGAAAAPARPQPQVAS